VFWSSISYPTSYKPFIVLLDDAKPIPAPITTCSNCPEDMPDVRSYTQLLAAKNDIKLTKGWEIEAKPPTFKTTR